MPAKGRPATPAQACSAAPGSVQSAQAYPAELSMPYLLLIVEPVGQRAERTPEEGRAAYDAMVRYADGLKARGLLAAAQSLASQDEAVRVQVRGGRASLLDGPYAEAKEMIGGFFLLNCETREEALAVAAECPAAQWCTVEVRRLAPCFE